MNSIKKIVENFKGEKYARFKLQMLDDDGSVDNEFYYEGYYRKINENECGVSVLIETDSDFNILDDGIENLLWLNNKNIEEFLNFAEVLGGNVCPEN